MTETKKWFDFNELILTPSSDLSHMKYLLKMSKNSCFSVYVKWSWRQRYCRKVGPASLTECAWKAAPVADCVIICCLSESDANYRQIPCANWMKSELCFHVRKSGPQRQKSWKFEWSKLIEMFIKYLNIGQTDTREPIAASKEDKIDIYLSSCR